MSGTDTIERGAIAEAYLDLADEAGWDFVRVSALRERLAGRVEGLDEILIRMFCEQEVNLVPQENQMALTPADRAAAVRCGGEDKHLISWSG
jgi:hypothetical protein